MTNLGTHSTQPSPVSSPVRERGDHNCTPARVVAEFQEAAVVGDDALACREAETIAGDIGWPHDHAHLPRPDKPHCRVAGALQTQQGLAVSATTGDFSGAVRTGRVPRTSTCE